MTFETPPQRASGGPSGKRNDALGDSLSNERGTKHMVVNTFVIKMAQAKTKNLALTV